MKSTRETAEEIATRAVGRNPNCQTRWAMCADAIEQALRDERERCARIVLRKAKRALLPEFGDEIVAAFRKED